jgi:hypothetical protein
MNLIHNWYDSLDAYWPTGRPTQEYYLLTELSPSRIDAQLLKELLVFYGTRNINDKKNKVKLSLYQAMEAHRVVRRRGSHVI